MPIRPPPHAVSTAVGQRGGRSAPGRSAPRAPASGSATTNLQYRERRRADRAERASDVRPSRPRPAAWRVVAVAAMFVLAVGTTVAVWFGGTAATLWDVDDERTAHFMRIFYRNLTSGMSKSAALRATKLELKRDPRTAVPRYWAPFVLMGEPAQPVPIGMPASPPWTLLLSGGALAALLMALYRRGRSGYMNCS